MSRKSLVLFIPRKKMMTFILKKKTKSLAVRTAGIRLGMGYLPILIASGVMNTVNFRERIGDFHQFFFCLIYLLTFAVTSGIIGVGFVGPCPEVKARFPGRYPHMQIFLDF
jgi:hypothetical protein